MWANVQDYILPCISGGLVVLGVGLFAGYMRRKSELATLKARVARENEDQRAALSRLQLATRSTLDALPHAVAIFSPEGKIDLANHTAETLFKLTPQSRNHP